MNLMPMSSSPTPRPSHSKSLFLTTRWSMVLSAQEKDSPSSARALETLCQTYWYPLYAYARRQGHSAHDAQDLTQAFFAQLLAKDYLSSVAQEKGRFRAFLVTAMKRFLLNEWDKVRTQKRGYGISHVSLDPALAESRYGNEAADILPPDQVFERRWALTLLDQAVARLRSAYEESGRVKEFEHLKVHLTAERGDVAYPEIAATLDTTEGAARVALHRLRKQFRQFFRDEIAGTVADPSEVEDEVRYVVSVLSRR